MSTTSSAADPPQAAEIASPDASLAERAPTEWVQLYAVDLFRLARARNQFAELAQLIQRDSGLQRFLIEFQQLLS